ncbi:MAG: hypothetical protein LEGION0398_MBIBDBAK_00766 [Legionellaceae bacterium]
MKIDISFLKNWETLSLSETIDTICQPLKKLIGLEQFIYRKTFHDGKRVYLTNTAKQLHWYFENHFYLIDGYQGKPDSYKNEFAIWPLPGQNPLFLNEMINAFDCGNGFTIVETTSDGMDVFFYLISGTKNSDPNIYLTNLNALIKFNIYFKEKARDLIRKISNTGALILDSNLQINNSKEEEFNHFISEISLPNYIEINKNKITLTNRENECLQLIKFGNTNKEIARKLGISPRTVETYLNQIKTKTGIRTQKSLISLL